PTRDAHTASVSFIAAQPYVCAAEETFQVMRLLSPRKMTTASGPLKEAIGSLDEVPAGRRDPIPAGGLAGMSADRFGIRRTLLTAIVLLGMLIIRCTTEIPALFWMVLVTWGVLSWAI